MYGDFSYPQILGNTADINVVLIYFVCFHLRALHCWLVVTLDLLFYTYMYEGHFSTDVSTYRTSFVSQTTTAKMRERSLKDMKSL